MEIKDTQKAKELGVNKITPTWKREYRWKQIILYIVAMTLLFLGFFYLIDMQFYGTYLASVNDGVSTVEKSVEIWKPNMRWWIYGAWLFGYIIRSFAPKIYKTVVKF